MVKINRSIFASIAMLPGLMLIPFPVWSQPCRLVEMKVTGQTAQAANVSVDLGEAAPPDPSSPPAYQGPPRIRVDDGATCTANGDVSILFGQPWLGVDKVYLSTYSGSENRVYAIDTRDCRTVWKSRRFEGPPAKYQNGALMLGTHRVHLDGTCMPVR